MYTVKKTLHHFNQLCAMFVYTQMYHKVPVPVEVGQTKERAKYDVHSGNEKNVYFDENCSCPMKPNFSILLQAWLRITTNLHEYLQYIIKVINFFLEVIGKIKWDIDINTWKQNVMEYDIE